MDRSTRGGARSREGRPGRRLFALALLLVLSLSLAAALALQAIGTARRHRQTAERTLEDYAAFAAFILASQTYRQLGGSVVETFASWPAAGTPPPASLPKGTVCPAGPTWLEQPPGRPIRLSGAGPAAGLTVVSNWFSILTELSRRADQ